jgi:hypothetical protein
MGHRDRNIMQLSFLDCDSTAGIEIALDDSDDVGGWGQRHRAHLLEHIVVLDMIRQGYFAYHDSTKGRDAVLDTGVGLKRVQVRSATVPPNCRNPCFKLAAGVDNATAKFGRLLSDRGVARRLMDVRDCDIVALIYPATENILYLPITSQIFLQQKYARFSVELIKREGPGSLKRALFFLENEKATWNENG